MIQSKIDQLEKAAQQMSEAMYQQQSQAQTEQPQPESPSDDDVMDAEFTEKN